MIGLNTTRKFYRTILMNREKSQEILGDIENQIVSHIGKFALLKEKEGRNVCVYLIRIVNRKEGEYSCYDSRGKFRGFMKKYIDHTQIMTDEQRLVFLDL